MNVTLLLHVHFLDIMHRTKIEHQHVKLSHHANLTCNMCHFLYTNDSALAPYFRLVACPDL
jgi:hypothetical protein